MTLRPAPAFVVRIELEAAPSVLVSAHRDVDRERLLVWLERQPALVDLLNRAIELEQEAKAA